MKTSLILILAGAACAQTYDVVLAGGRVWIPNLVSMRCATSVSEAAESPLYLNNLSPDRLGSM